MPEVSTLRSLIPDGLTAWHKNLTIDKLVGKPNPVRYLQELVDPGAAQISVHNDRGLVALGNHTGQVHSHGCLAIGWGCVLVTRIVRRGRSILKNCRLVRRARNASDIGERGCLTVINGPSSDQNWQLFP